MLTPCAEDCSGQSGYSSWTRLSRDETKEDCPHVMRSRHRDKLPHLTHEINRTRSVETSFECHHLTRMLHGESHGRLGVVASRDMPGTCA